MNFSVSEQRLQISLLDLSTERLIFFQNISDPQNISKCGVFCLPLMNGEMNFVSSENIGEKICVCQTTELAKNLLRTSATCSWPKACYLSNLLTTVIFSFFRHQAERYHNVLGL